MTNVDRLLLERALAAEERAEAVELALADARARLKGALGADPTNAVAALGWISRCERAEALVREIVRHLDQRSLTGRDLPDGWEPRARAQLKAADIAKADEDAVNFRRPDDHDYWSTAVDGKDRRFVVNERRPGR